MFNSRLPLRSKTMLQKSTLDFLAELRLNNNKMWFDENRAGYEESKADVLQLAEQLLRGLSEADPDLLPLKAADCLFRINRDVRFSADKSPYKSNMGFWMSRGGKKSPDAGYYVHIEPGGKSFVAAGIYAPEPKVLKLIRQEILYGFEEFKCIIENQRFRDFFDGVELPGHKAARVPRDFDANHPAADFLKLKSIVAVYALDDEVLVSRTLLPTVLSVFSAALPLVRFLNLPIDDVKGRGKD